MSYLPYLADRSRRIRRARLIAHFGDDAGFEAAARADRSRDLGNHLHFCRWRQIERLIVLLGVRSRGRHGSLIALQPLSASKPAVARAERRS